MPIIDNGSLTEPKLTSMKIVITGGKGMVARAAAVYCRNCGDDVISLSREELDISDLEAVFETIKKTRPHSIINCAAYTDVDGAEKNEETAYLANAAGPENLAAASKEFGAVFVTISTDYVFDGTKAGFYTQNDSPNPQSVYARSKYEGELRSAAANPESIIVRSGWIYGHGGTNFLSVLPDLVSRGIPFKAIDDSFGTPTFADDLAIRLRELATAKAKGIFHATNSGNGCTYFDFARFVVDSMGGDLKMIEAVSDSALKRPAARPRNSRLRCARNSDFGLKPLRDWKEALSVFLHEKRRQEAA